MPMTNNSKAQNSGRARCTKYHIVSENVRKAIVKYGEDNHCSISFKKKKKKAQDMRIRTSTFKTINKIYKLEE